MHVSVEPGEGLEKRLTVTLPAEQVDAGIDKKLQEIAKTVRLDGFRPGKVPLRVVRQRFGGQVRQEVYGDLVQQTYFEAVSGQDLTPAGEPGIEIRPAEDDGSFSYVATFEVMPSIELPAFAELELKRPTADVTDADVDSMIAKLREQRKTWQPVERAAASSDRVTIDFVGSVDGEPFEGGSAQDVPLELGSGRMVPGFEDGLVGAVAGEERSLEVTFPEDYRAEHLAGKAATFEVTVKQVEEAVLPEIDEEFVKAFGVESGDADTLRAEVRGNMARELRQKLRSTTKERVMDALLSAADILVPKAMIASESKALKQQVLNDMRQSGQQAQIDFPLDMFKDQAERRVKLGLLIGEIIKAAELTVDNDRVRAMVEEFAESYENPEEVVEHTLKDQQQRASVENLVLEDQVVDWVLDQAQVEEEPSTFEALTAAT